MALRPIIFKEDDEINSKKGNILPEDFSAYFSLLTGKQVGILDVLKTGTLPCTYSDIDNSVVGQTTITFNAGYISVYGRLVYIEGGTKFTFNTPVAGKGYLCLRIDLSAVGSTECEMVLIPASSGLQTATSLVEDNTASYEFRLYDYNSTGSSVTLSNPTNEKIVNLKDYLNGANFTTQATTDEGNNLATTLFVKNKITDVLGFSKTTGSNLAQASNGRTNEHYFTVLDFLGTRMIYGTVNAMEANTNTTVTWGDNLLKASSLDKAVFIPSFTTQTRTNPNDNNMGEPCYIKQVGVNGFVMFNSNVYTVTGTYLVIGEKP